MSDLPALWDGIFLGFIVKVLVIYYDNSTLLLFVTFWWQSNSKCFVVDEWIIRSMT